jgi:hypothetical protein
VHLQGFIKSYSFKIISGFKAIDGLEIFSPVCLMERWDKRGHIENMVFNKDDIRNKW